MQEQLGLDAVVAGLTPVQIALLILAIRAAYIASGYNEPARSGVQGEKAPETSSAIDTNVLCAERHPVLRSCIPSEG